MNKSKTANISWEKNISLISNPLIIRQLAMVIIGSGLFMAFILTVVLSASGEYRDIPAMLLISLIVTAGIAFPALLVILIFFSNKIRVCFTLDHNGVLWETVDKKAKTAGRLAVITGILGSSPHTAGAGALSVAREKEYVRWKDLAAVEFNKRHLLIILRNSWRPVMMISCLPDNYEKVAEYVSSFINPADTQIENRNKPLGKALFRTSVVTLASVPLFMLSAFPFELDIFIPLVLYLFALATVWLIPFFGWVVIACALFLAVRITITGFSEFYYLHDTDQAALFFSYISIIFFFWLSREYLKGKLTSLLMER